MKFVSVIACLILAKFNEANDTKQKIGKQENALEVIQKLAKPKVESFWDTSCYDLYDTKYCRILRDEWKFCDFANKNRMDEMCRKTCGFCKQAADCSLTKFKCCPDNATPKADMIGSNCLSTGCKDKYRDLCPQYTKDCNEIGWSGLWMRENCKKTCGVCKENNLCEDDKNQKVFCPSWKSYGMCNKKGSLMKQYCRKTCNFCDENTNN